MLLALSCPLPRRTGRLIACVLALALGGIGPGVGLSTNPVAAKATSGTGDAWSTTHRFPGKHEERQLRRFNRSVRRTRSFCGLRRG
jgi:hypothetical protein